MFRTIPGSSSRYTVGKFGIWVLVRLGNEFAVSSKIPGSSVRRKGIIHKDPENRVRNGKWQWIISVIGIKNIARAFPTPNGKIKGAGLATWMKNPMQTLFLPSGAWAYVQHEPLQDPLSIVDLYALYFPTILHRKASFDRNGGLKKWQTKRCLTSYATRS